MNRNIQSEEPLANACNHWYIYETKATKIVSKVPGISKNKKEMNAKGAIILGHLYLSSFQESGNPKLIRTTNL